MYTGKKLPWNQSSEKAKDLKADDFGTAEEIAEKARMLRTANSKTEVRPILQEIQSRGSLINKENSAIKASLSDRAINKFLNNKAKNQSFDEKAHLQATVNVDKLYFNAIEKWSFELDPRKPNKQLKDRKFLYSPMWFEERIILVKLTVMEYQNGDINLYSLEAIDAEPKENKKEDAGILSLPESESSNSLVTPSTHPLSNLNIAHLFEPVNEYANSSSPEPAPSLFIIRFPGLESPYDTPLRSCFAGSVFFCILYKGSSA
ncbi:hypothetical protein AGMMS49546_29350 [Spirochaetia bacterium]|nr:hypothetical protein AGMMS49546_29350 [Spirochaetia bacterium]